VTGLFFLWGIIGGKSGFALVDGTWAELLRPAKVHEARRDNLHFSKNVPVAEGFEDAQIPSTILNPIPIYFSEFYVKLPSIARTDPRAVLCWNWLEVSERRWWHTTVSYSARLIDLLGDGRSDIFNYNIAAYIGHPISKIVDLGSKISDSQLGGVKNFTVFELALHRFPLLLGIFNVITCQHNNCDGSQSGYNTMVSLYEARAPLDTSPDCFNRPHYVGATLLAIAGIACFILAAGCWKLASLSDDLRGGIFFLGSLIPLSLCFLSFYFALGMIGLMVEPCAA